MSIFRKEIFDLTKKNILTNKDKNILLHLTRFSLEHFHYYRHEYKSGRQFNDIDYSRLSKLELLNLCYNPSKFK